MFFWPLLTSDEHNIRNMGIPKPLAFGHIAAYKGKPYWFVLKVESSTHADSGIIQSANSLIHSFV